MKDSKRIDIFHDIMSRTYDVAYPVRVTTDAGAREKYLNLIRSLSTEELEFLVDFHATNGSPSNPDTLFVIADEISERILLGI